MHAMRHKEYGLIEKGTIDSSFIGDGGTHTMWKTTSHGPFISDKLTHFNFERLVSWEL